ncbi:MAG: P-loop NTPase [archaeon]|nr:P-loop NTPase [archaeon]
MIFKRCDKINKSKSKSIAVTGGKGGTGKTLVAINLAVKFAMEGLKVLIIDCDVENPNCNILLGKKLIDSNVMKTPVNIFQPSFNQDKCNQCGNCREACYRNAILQFPEQFPFLMENMCSGCETCIKICPMDAITPSIRRIGNHYYISSIYPNLDLLLGELTEGEAVSIKIVEQILSFGESLDKKKSYDIIIIDTAPGAHCDVEKSLSEADQIICVTEPTPFGEHDMKRILDLIDILGQKSNYIINRANITDYRTPIIELTEKRGIPLLGEIPLDNIIIEDYAKGIPFVTDERKFPAKSSFLEIYQRIKTKIEVNI